MQIHTTSGKTIDTMVLPQQWEPVGCARCGQRIGWHDADFGDEPPVCLCDDCAADEREPSEEEE
jgi:hypothetical protein